MAVSQELIEEIRNRNDIVSVISEYINLKKTGRNFKTLCPFHTEKTASFIVSQDKQIYHCFGCGAGGNVFNFIMQIDNISFMEAVEKLAKKAGMTLPAPRQTREILEKNREYEELYKLNELAADYYHRYLLQAKEAQKARTYLQKRGLDKAIIEKFRLGYAPGQGDVLLKLINSKGIKDTLAEKAGLINTTDGRRFYDYFRDRIIFPISDSKSRVIAFGGRRLDEAQSPKYLNSPETPLFNKGRLFYGINLASPSIRHKQEVLILEGYLDTISCHQFEIENSVATLGTALTPDHIQLLKRYTEQIIMVYDADKAGVKATLRGLDLLIDSGLKVKVAVLPTGQDPDEYLRKEGAGVFKEIISKSLSLIDYKLQQTLTNSDITTVAGKVYVAGELLPTVAKIKNIIEQREEIKKLSQRLSLDEEVLLLQLNKIIKQDSSGLAQIIGEVENIETGALKAQRLVLQLILNDNHLAKIVKRELELEHFTQGELNIIAQAIFHLIDTQDSYTPSEVIDYSIRQSANESLAAIVAQLSFHEELDGADKEKILYSLIESIKKESKRIRYQQLEQEVQKMLENQIQFNQELFQEYKVLTQYFKGSNKPQ